MLRKQVILDVDTGVDDALAILLALNSPELDVKAITVSGGNVPLGKCALNTARIVNLASELYGDTDRPPVAIGADPSEERPDVTDAHGPDGLGGISQELSFKEEGNLIQEKDAAALVKGLLEEALQRKEKITIVTTGPMTNFAIWAESFPDLLYEGVEEVISMGGAFFTCGNRSAVAEFNILSDPGAAARMVSFCRGDNDEKKRSIPLTFVGLDVTHKVALRREDLNVILQEYPGNRVARTVLDLTRIYMDYYFKNEKHAGCPLHDPLAVAMAIDPSLCRTGLYHVEVQVPWEPCEEGCSHCREKPDYNHAKGMTIADTRPSRLFKNKERAVTRVCEAVNAEAFEKMFTERVMNLKV